MMKTLRSYIYLFLFLSSCSSPKKEINEHETLYSTVSDSLVKYKKEISSTTDSTNQMLNDFTSLSYQSFKSKYQYTDNEMDILSINYTTTYEIGHTLRLIQQNSSPNTALVRAQKMLDELKIDTSGYKYIPKEGEKEIKRATPDQEEKILMEAFGNDDSPIKKK